MTLNHSNTWPVSTCPVVQLKLDANGKTYKEEGKKELIKGKWSKDWDKNGRWCKILKGSADGIDQDVRYDRDSLEKYLGDDRSKERKNSVGKNGVILPLYKRHVELFTKMSSRPPLLKNTVRTDTVSTILEQETEFDCENNFVPGKISLLFFLFIFVTSFMSIIFYQMKNDFVINCS